MKNLFLLICFLSVLAPVSAGKCYDSVNALRNTTIKEAESDLESLSDQNLLKSVIKGRIVEDINKELNLIVTTVKLSEKLRKVDRNATISALVDNLQFEDKMVKSVKFWKLSDKVMNLLRLIFKIVANSLTDTIRSNCFN